MPETPPPPAALGFNPGDPSADVTPVAATTDSRTPHPAAVAPGAGPRPVTGPAASPVATPLLELVGAATELTFLVDGSFRIVYAGGPIGSLLGHDAAEIVGRPVVELVHPSHQAPLSAAMAHVRDGAAVGEATLRWVGSDGRPGLDLATSFPPLPAAAGDPATDGFMVRAAHQPTATAAIAGLEGRDEELRALAPSLPLAVFLLDERGRCVHMSARWATMSGMPEQASLGLGWIGAIVDEDRQNFRVAAAQAHARRTGWRQQFRIRDAAGATVWIDAAAAPRLAADGTVSGYVGLLSDATAEVHARAELNRRTTIVESTAEFVVMDDRGPRLSYAGSDTVPLAATPPVPAPEQAETTRPSLGGLPSEAQTRYLNEIRPTVLSQGVWQETAGRHRPPATPADLTPPATVPMAPTEPMAPNATTATGPVDLADEVLPQPPMPVVEHSGEAVAAQPVAWNFDADGEQATTEAVPADTWSGGWTAESADATAEAAAPVATPDVAPAAPVRPNVLIPDDAPLAGSEQVFVGLVGPSGRVETVAAVTDSILEPVPWENVGDQLPTIDPITGLANRALFLERIGHGLARMKKDGVSVALMLPTLHGYAELRQRVGRKTGDDQLFVMAKRLEATIRQTDTAARIGEEDFAILAIGWFFPGDVENVAMRFVRKLSEPVPSVGEQVAVPCSMGVAISEPGLDLHQLLRRAQRARKMAAELGPGRVYVYREQ